MTADNATLGSSASAQQPSVTNATHVSRDEITGIITHVLRVVGPHFTRAERSRLVLVGEASDLIGFGDWTVASIGCPIHQAGIPRATDAELFSRHFDAAIYDLLREKGQDQTSAEVPQVLAID